MTKRFRLSLPAEWNYQVFDKSDFDRICDECGVYTRECILNVPGLYCRYGSTPVIFINKNQSALLKLFVSFHELGHFWLHSPGHQFSIDQHDHSENEANIVAACALIPITIYKTKSESEIIDEYRYSRELFNLRSEIYRTWRI